MEIKKIYKTDRTDYIIVQIIIIAIGFLIQTKIQINTIENIVYFIIFYIVLGILSLINSIGRLKDINLSPYYSLLNLIPILNVCFILFLSVKKGSESK
ncbi:DUF805 domain-containing protein [Chryseobacterium sp. 18068]|uniref:DUF805 domain-containing protein n=1 Tax=Chryseobacterium sp. 18068 TaxID=2681414 RepID=UPI0039778A9E